MALKRLLGGGFAHVLAHLRVAENPADVVAWNRVLQLLDGIGPKTASQLTDWIRAAAEPFQFDQAYASEKYVERLRELAEMLRAVRTYAEQHTGRVIWGHGYDPHGFPDGLPTRGTIRTPSGMHAVRGNSWLDREWSTSVLSAGVSGWDWLSLQLTDSTELMMYRLRRADGTVDPFSAATIIDRDGTPTGIAASDFTMLPTRTWQSRDGVAYPVAWRVTIPSLALELDVAAVIDDQELDLAVRYWEGMVSARGSKGGDPVSGRGYLEMTGYAGEPGPGR